MEHDSIPGDFVNRSILQFIQDDQLEAVLEQCEEIEVVKGNFRDRGRPNQFLFVLLEGQTTLLNNSNQEILKIIPGRSLELGQVIESSADWKFKWRCDSNCRFIKIPWPQVSHHFSKNKIMFRYLKRVATSVALQKLKNDMLATGVSKEAIYEFIGSLRYGTYREVLGDWSQRAFVVINQSNLRMRAEVGDRVFDVAHFKASDSALLDLPNLNVSFESEPEDHVWYFRQVHVETLSESVQVEKFFQVYLPLDTSTDAEEIGTVLYRQPGETRRADPALVEPSSAGFIGRFGSRWMRFGLKNVPIVANLHSPFAALYCVGDVLGVALNLDQMVVEQGTQTILGNTRLMINVAREYGLALKAVEVNSLRQLSSFPCVLNFLDRSMVVFGKKNDRLKIADFSNGTIGWQPISVLESKWRPSFVIVPRTQFRVSAIRAPAGSFAIRQHLGMNLSMTTGLVIVGTLITSLLGLVSPLLQGFVIDSSIRGGTLEASVGAIVLMSFVLICGALGVLLMDRISEFAAVRQSSLIFSRMMASLNRMDVENVHRLGISSIVTRMSDISRLKTYYQTVMQLPGALLLIFFGHVILWMMNSGFAVFSFFFFLSQTVIIFFLSASIRKLTEWKATASASERKIALEHLNAPEEIAGLDLALSVRWRWDSNLAAKIRAVRIYNWLESFEAAQAVLTKEFLRIGILALGALYYLQNETSFGQVLSATMIAALMAASFEVIAAALTERFVSDTYFNRLSLIARPKPRSPKRAKDVGPVELAGDIAFKDVSFSFQGQDGRQVLKRVSFRIKAGSRVCILGHSGSGKSTLAQLMNGLIAPTSGQILFDNYDLNGMSKSALRSKLILVEQGGDLFAGSIQQNITLFAETPSLDQVAHAARISYVDEFALQYPDNYGHQLGYLGGGISAGQKQRLLLARMIYLNPQIAILDEATSHLDTVTESIVLKNIFNHFTGRTVVVFTQRVNVARQSDVVIFLEHGAVAEVGSHIELMNKRSLYFRFFTRYMNAG